LAVTWTDVKSWLARGGIGLLALLAIIGVGDVIRFFLSSPPKVLDEHQSVAVDWNNSVRRLGLNPIYPPQEDLYVGDIFAVIKTSDNNYNRVDEVFGDHAIKLAHVDMTKTVKATYAPLPVFPDTMAQPAHDGDFWPQRPSEDLFAPGQRKVLSLVAFPAFSIHSTRKATIAGSGQGVVGWLSGALGISRDDEETEQLSFPAPETYGVDAIDAQVALFRFCNDPRTAPFCTELAVRNMLSMVVGKEIWRQTTDPSTQQPGGYASEVELMLVRQVFLTRSIVQLRSADTVSGATIEKLLPRLRSGGVLASVRGEPPAAKGKPIEVRAFMTQPDGGLLARYAQAVAQKRLMIPIAERLPLAKAGEAQQRAEEHKVEGKILLIP